MCAQPSAVTATTPGSTPAAAPTDWVAAITDRPARGATVDVDHAWWREEAVSSRRRADAAEQRAEQAEQRIAAMEQALENAAGIEQAKGLIMGGFGVDPDQAFEALVWVSQHTNIKLRVVAETFIARAHGLELGADTREQLTQLLTHITEPSGSCSPPQPS